MNKAFLLVKNGAWATCAALVTKVLALVSNLILARLLLPEQFGVISVAYVFWAFANLFNQGTAGDFIVYKGVSDPKVLNTTYTIGIATGFLLASGLLLIAPWVASFFEIPDLFWLLAIFAVNLILFSLQSVYAGVLNRQMQQRQLANATLMAALVRVATTTGCALIGWGYWSFAIGDSLHWLALCTLTRRHIQHRFRFQLDPSSRREILAFCSGATGSSLGYYANTNSDNFIVGKLLGKTSLGYYNLAYQLTMTLTTVLQQGIGQVGMSAFAQLEDSQQEKALLQVVRETAFMSAPLYGLFFLIVNVDFISLVFGEKWRPVAGVIPGLLIFAYFRLINIGLISMLAAKGRTDLNARVNLAIAPIAILSFFIGADRGNMIGVSVAVAIVLGLVWTFWWWLISCQSLHWQMGKFLLPCMQALGFSITAILAVRGMPYFLQPIMFMIGYIFLLRIFNYQIFAKYWLGLQQIKQTYLASRR